ncbi:MAG: hypothetical protein ACMUIG_10590 [Thermoplasmatota archaeon]
MTNDSISTFLLLRERSDTRNLLPPTRADAARAGEGMAVASLG